MKRSFLLIVVLTLGVQLAWGAYPKIRNFPKSVEGAGTQNWDFAQTAGGSLYFANQSGLVEFDGNRWDLYYMPNGTTVRSLLYDEDSERLYAGAFDEMGYWESGTDGRLRYNSMKALFEGEETMTEFWSIHRIAGTVYFRTDWGIFRYSEQDNRADVLHPEGGKIDCSAIVRGSLLVATVKEGPMILSGDMFIPLPGAAHLAGKNVRAMLPWGKNEILIATDIHGLFVYNGRDIVPFRTRFDSQLRENQLYCAATDGHTLALGSIRGGLYTIDVRGGEGMHIDRSSGLQNNTILSLFFDMDSNLWLGLDNGIDFLMLDMPDYAIFSKDADSGAGYSSLLYEGKLYLGTNQGLFCAEYTPSGTEPGKFRAVGKGDNAVAQVWRLDQIDGTLFCSHDHGLLAIHGGETTNISGVPGVWKVIPFKGYDDKILGCSYQGLFVLEKRGGRWVFSHGIEGWNESSGMFVEDPDGSIWFSHWMKGLFRLTLDKEKRRVVSAEYFGIEKGLPSDRNNIPSEVKGEVVFSSENGFYIYNPEHGVMVRERRLNPLFRNLSPVSMKIHDLGQGDLLFTSNTFCGLAIADKKGGYTLDSLSMRHIADELIMGFDNHSMMSDELLLVSHENGFSFIDLRRIKTGETARKAHPVFIKNIWSTNRGERLIYGERGESGGNGENKSEGAAARSMPRLAYRDNSIRIEASSPEYRDPNAVKYSFMLEGYDKGWSAWSNTYTKEYTRLAEGSYTLRVRANNSFTQLVSETELEFSISPPWYRSYWAIAFYFLCLLALMWLAIKLINRRANFRVNEIKRQKEREIVEQKHRYEEATKEKEKELVVLQNRALENDLRSKSQELASSTMNIIRKNEILMQIEESIGKVIPNVVAGDPQRAAGMLRKVQKDIRDNIEHDSDWEKFESNFDAMHENYLKRLSEDFPGLNLNDKRLCAYLRMDLQSKDIAPLMNISVRSVEMARYRLRKKMGFDREVNLSDFLQNF